jgi:hypothetical protein
MIVAQIDRLTEREREREGEGEGEREREKETVPFSSRLLNNNFRKACQAIPIAVYLSCSSLGKELSFF